MTLIDIFGMLILCGVVFWFLYMLFLILGSPVYFVLFWLVNLAVPLTEEMVIHWCAILHFVVMVGIVIANSDEFYIYKD
jgi:hypothetical protein